MLKGGAKTLIDNLSNIIHKYLYSNSTKDDTFDNIMFIEAKLSISIYILWYHGEINNNHNCLLPLVKSDAEYFIKY